MTLKPCLRNTSEHKMIDLVWLECIVDSKTPSKNINPIARPPSPKFWILKSRCTILMLQTILIFSDLTKPKDQLMWLVSVFTYSPSLHKRHLIDEDVRITVQIWSFMSMMSKLLFTSSVYCCRRPITVHIWKTSTTFK